MIYYYICNLYDDNLFWDMSQNDWVEDRDEASLFETREEVNEVADKIEDSFIEETWKVKR